MLNSEGQYEQKRWDAEKNEMLIRWTGKVSDCDVYGMCGQFASFNT